jgi:sulfur-oxidizing protein SoxX
MIRLPLACVALAAAVIVARADAAQPAQLVPYRVVDGAIPEPLTETPGDPERGLALVLNRSKGNCVTCHKMPVKADFQGDLGPPLEGVASRWSPGELRLRIVDSKQINPDSNMPSYSGLEGLNAVRRDWVGKTMLTAQEVEDVLAFLLTLK